MKGIFVGLILPVMASTAFASPINGDENVQLVYTGNKLSSVTVVTQGNEAKKIFDAVSDSYPNLVKSMGKLGLRPEIDLPNLICGLNSQHGGFHPAPPPVYQCYSSSQF
jgi:hypothetical protein